VRDQLNECGFFACWWLFEKLDQFSGLLGRQRLRWNAQSSALGNVGSVGL
jgi:hypothetical protein